MIFSAILCFFQPHDASLMIIFVCVDKLNLLSWALKFWNISLKSLFFVIPEGYGAVCKSLLFVTPEVCGAFRH